MTPIKLGPITLDARDSASQGSAILGIRDSGKSYSATMLAEQYMLAGIPIIAFDPIGIWRFLRVAGRGQGFPVVVAGGEHGDLPLTPHSAPEIVRAAMRDGVSLVLDLYSMELSKSDWKRIVESSLAAMLYENKRFGLRHVFIEEAAEFCPQIMPKDGLTAKVYDQVERLARMGGNALLGYTLINQRAEQVNKAVLELCDNLFLHRQKGKNSIASLAKWLDVAGAKAGREITDSLPTLAQGECWAWVSGSAAPVRLTMPKKRTFHPDRRAMHAAVASTEHKTVDVGAFVAQMAATLQAVTAEAEANDPKLLKAKVAELERKLAAAPAAGPDRAELQRLQQDAWRDGYQTAAEKFDRMAVKLADALTVSINGFLSNIGDTHSVVAPKADVAQRIERRVPDPKVAGSTPAVRATPRATSTDMPAAERKFLTVLAQRGALPRNKIALFAGYSVKSRHVDNTLAALRSNGWADGGRDSVAITPAGRNALGNYEPLPTGADLRRYWLGQLDKASAAFLQVLIDAYPASLTRDQIAERTGYSPTSRHVDNTLAVIRGFDLAHGGRDAIKASEDLF